MIQRISTRLQFGILLVSLALASVFTTNGVGAVAGSQFNPGRIIDDVVFFSSNTMSANDIQNFLNSKVPVCDTWHSSGDPANQPPFTCLKDYRQDTPSRAAESGLCNTYNGGNKSSAQIIYDVAQSCGINPQVLLVLLQKEQLLITDTWPWNIQYQSATGYGCPDTAACDAEYYGFFNQVYNAARQFRVYAKNPSGYGHRMGRVNNILFNPSSSCGSSPVYIQNQATAGLYNYTPYQPNAAALNNLYGTGDSCSAYGNRNFWRMFNDWFGASVIGSAPSPLYKSTTTQTIYVIAGGQKHAVPSFEVMEAYGLLKFPAAEVGDSLLSQYATADVLTVVGKKSVDPSGALYLFDDGKRYPIDIKACAKFPDGSLNPSTSWGIDCFNGSVSKTLANELIDLYTVQDITIPEMIINNNLVWKLENGKKRQITDPQFVEVLGGWGKAKWMKNINAQQPVGKMLIVDGSLVKFDNSQVVYLLTDEKLFPIPGPDEIGAWALWNKPSYVFPASFNSADPLPVNTTALKSYAQDSQGNKFLLLTNGKKSSISTKTDWPISQFTILPDYHLARIPTVGLSEVFRTSAGEIYTVIDGKRRTFPTGEDIFYSGYSLSSIVPVGQSVATEFNYDGFKLSNGRLFKVSGSDEIRYVNANNSSLLLEHTNHPNLPYDKLITVDTVTGLKYPITGTYQ